MSFERYSAMCRVHAWSCLVVNDSRVLLLWAFGNDGQVGETTLMRWPGWATRSLGRRQRGSFGHGILWRRGRVKDVRFLFLLRNRREIGRVFKHATKHKLIRYRFKGKGTLMTMASSPPVALYLHFLGRHLCCGNHEGTLLNLLSNPVFDSLFTLSIVLLLQERDASTPLG